MLVHDMSLVRTKTGTPQIAVMDGDGFCVEYLALLPNDGRGNHENATADGAAFARDGKGVGVDSTDAESRGDDDETSGDPASPAGVMIVSQTFRVLGYEGEPSPQPTQPTDDLSNSNRIAGSLPPNAALSARGTNADDFPPISTAGTEFGDANSNSPPATETAAVAQSAFVRFKSTADSGHAASPPECATEQTDDVEAEAAAVVAAPSNDDEQITEAVDPPTAMSQPASPQSEATADSSIIEVGGLGEDVQDASSLHESPPFAAATSLPTDQLRPSPGPLPSTLASTQLAHGHPGHQPTAVWLQSDELGTLQISLRDDHGVSTIQIVADNPDTARLMQQNVDILRAELPDATRVQISRSYDGELSGGGQGGRGTFADSDNHRGGKARSADADDVQPPSAKVGPKQLSGVLDLRL